MNSTHQIAIRDGRTILYAIDGEAWASTQGTAARLDEATTATVLAIVTAAGVPYDVIEHERHPLGSVPAFTTRRVGGTEQLFRI